MLARLRNVKRLAPVLLFLALGLAGCSSSNPAAPKDDPVPEAEPAPTPVTQTLKIIPIGDSVTRGKDGTSSYRRPLWLDLQSAGADVDFVGSQNSGPTDDYDRDHEAYTGRTAGHLVGPVASAAPRFEPDIALIHLGTNDVRQGLSDSTTSDGLGRIIDELRAANPKVVILLAQIIPTRNSEITAKIRSLNKEIASLAGRRDSSKSPVVVVDQFTGFDPDAHTFDGVHPNDAGDERMASRWHEALLEFLP